MKRLSVLALGLAVVAPAPAFAQDEAGDSVNMVIVYGDDKCPTSDDPNEIVICPRLEEEERFRIPPLLRASEAPENESWSRRVESMETVGAFGTLSCSPSGMGGWMGCTQQLIDAAYEEKRTSSDVRFSQLIEEERQKRLDKIDEEAAAEQARVEALEREYEAKLEAERQAELPGEDTPPAITPESGESD